MKLEDNKDEWVKIAGYGELGDWNWGFDYSLIETEKWLKECQKHIGQTVLLTGGGSLGKCWLGKLVAVWVDRVNNKLIPRVRLENLDPPWSYYGENVFEPWLGSWQISVKKEILKKEACDD